MILGEFLRYTQTFPSSYGESIKSRECRSWGDFGGHSRYRRCRVRKLEGNWAWAALGLYSLPAYCSTPLFQFIPGLPHISRRFPHLRLKKMFLWLDPAWEWPWFHFSPWALGLSHLLDCMPGLLCALFVLEEFISNINQLFFSLSLVLIYNCWL